MPDFGILKTINLRINLKYQRSFRPQIRKVKPSFAARIP